MKKFNEIKICSNFVKFFILNFIMILLIPMIINSYSYTKDKVYNKIKGIILDKETGEPIESMLTLHYKKLSDVISDIANIDVGKDGRFEIKNLKSGYYYITVMALPYYVNHIGRYFELRDGETKELIIRMRKGGRIFVRMEPQDVNINELRCYLNLYKVNNGIRFIKDYWWHFWKPKGMGKGIMIGGIEKGRYMVEINSGKGEKEYAPFLIGVEVRKEETSIAGKVLELREPKNKGYLKFNVIDKNSGKEPEDWDVIIRKYTDIFGTNVDYNVAEFNNEHKEGYVISGQLELYAMKFGKDFKVVARKKIHIDLKPGEKREIKIIF